MEQNTSAQEQFDTLDTWKKWYYKEYETSQRYWNKYREESHKAATLTGYLSGTAKWNTDIPVSERIKMLSILIELYEPQVNECKLYTRWVSEWKQSKEELEEMSK